MYFIPDKARDRGKPQFVYQYAHIALGQKRNKKNYIITKIINTIIKMNKFQKLSKIKTYVQIHLQNKYNST